MWFLDRRVLARFQKQFGRKQKMDSYPSPMRCAFDTVARIQALLLRPFHQKSTLATGQKVDDSDA